MNIANQHFTVDFENNNLEFQIKNEEKNNFRAALLFEKKANRQAPLILTGKDDIIKNKNVKKLFFEEKSEKTRLYCMVT